MARFFSWLWDNRVKNIIRGSVEDRCNVPHSDQSIEKALYRLNVEILDWRKVDMDPQAIREASINSNLRELHLWWSGNNAILRSWSEPDGLVIIPSLTKLYIHTTEVRDNSVHQN